MSEQHVAWQVPLAHPAFAGHFPGRPILPGVVLLDRALFLAQTQMQADSVVAVGWTGAVSQTKFLSPVTPGETITFVLTPDPRGGCRFAITGADGRAVASGSLAAKAA